MGKVTVPDECISEEKSHECNLEWSHYNPSLISLLVVKFVFKLGAHYLREVVVEINTSKKKGYSLSN